MASGPPDQDSALLQTPGVAWPTLALAAAALALWAAGLGAALAGRPVLAAVAGTVAAFASFTPLHDATHRSLARARWVNELVGRLAVVPLAAPFPGFRYVHLEHHRHTNEPVGDPDRWSGLGPPWLRPLRWVTQDFHYYAFIAARWRSRPGPELLETVGVLAGIAALTAAAVAGGQGRAVVFGWLLPARLALGLLAFSFDYLPHRPHEVPARVDPYRATHVSSSAVLTPLFLCQNYHLVHHLHPGVPFYRYPRIWRARREELVAKGATDFVLFLRPRPA